MCVFAFDCLYCNDQPLLDLPLAERRQQLAEALPQRSSGVVELAESTILALAPLSRQPGTGHHDAAVAALGQHDTTSAAASTVATAADVAPPAAGVDPSADPVGASFEAAVAGGTSSTPLEERVHEALLAALAGGAEGLMLKRLSGRYEPSRRSESWVKLKRDYMAGLADSLDLVPIGAWHGNGRKVRGHWRMTGAHDVAALPAVTSRISPGGVLAHGPPPCKGAHTMGFTL